MDLSFRETQEEREDGDGVDIYALYQEKLKKKLNQKNKEDGDGDGEGVNDITECLARLKLNGGKKLHHFKSRRRKGKKSRRKTKKSRRATKKSRRRAKKTRRS